MEKKPIIAVVGPTATGKTALGIALARQFQGEILSCDSMQIYQGLSIGTAKPTPLEQSQAVHHLVGFLPETQRFSVSDYVTLASQTASAIYQRGGKPILVGGTGLYARSFLRGVDFQQAGRDDALRASLERQIAQEGIAPLYTQLQALDPEAAQAIHPNNHQRVVRALEFCLTTKTPFSSQAKRSQEKESEYDVCMLYLLYRDRQKLYDAINRRVERMLQAGLLEEARGLYQTVQETGSSCTASQAIGYKELFRYFRGELSLEEAVSLIQMESRRYAKRQITWFGREEQAHRLYVDEVDSYAELVEMAIAIVSDSGIIKKEERQNEQ